MSSLNSKINVVRSICLVIVAALPWSAGRALAVEPTPEEILIGTWVEFKSRSMFLEETYLEGGRYESTLLVVNGDKADWVELGGPWKIENGHLIKVVTESSNVAVVPVGLQLNDRIVDLNERRFTYESDGARSVAFKKLNPEGIILPDIDSISLVFSANKGARVYFSEKDPPVGQTGVYFDSPHGVGGWHWGERGYDVAAVKALGPISAEEMKILPADGYDTLVLEESLIEGHSIAVRTPDGAHDGIVTILQFVRYEETGIQFVELLWTPIGS